MDEEIRKKHHVREELCTTRPKYRDGRKLKAVKVYTVSQESAYLLVQGVPAINVKAELEDLFSSYGEILSCQRLENYPAEEFTEVYLIKFARIQSARFAKRFRDDYNFYGGVLHVCYAPEYESVEETSKKLEERKKSVIRRVRQLERESERARAEAQLESDATATTSAGSSSLESAATREEDDPNSSEGLLSAAEIEQPTIIEFPEEFFFGSDDLPPPELYQSLAPPPSTGQFGQYVYPSQLTSPIITPQDPRLQESLRSSSSYEVAPR